jgi:hypothetical protein
MGLQQPRRGPRETHHRQGNLILGNNSNRRLGDGSPVLFVTIKEIGRLAFQPSRSRHGNRMLLTMAVISFLHLCVSVNVRVIYLNTIFAHFPLKIKTFFIFSEFSAQTPDRAKTTRVNSKPTLNEKEGGVWL